MKTTQDILNNVLANKSAIIKNVVAGILLVAIFAFEGCFNFATLGWEWSRLANPAYWVRIATKVTLLFAVKTIALLIFLDVARKANKDLVLQKTINDKYMKLKGPDFPKFVENKLNPDIKKEAWLKVVNNKLVKLEKHSKVEDRALYFADNKDIQQNNKYCLKRKQLEYELSDDFFEKNKNVISIKCDVVDPAIFDTPVTNERENKWQLTAKTKLAICMSLLASVLMLIITQSIWNAADIDKLENYNAIALFISIIMDFIFMIWQFFTGVIKAFTTINDQEVVPYSNRNRILKLYCYWKEPDKKDNLSIWLEELETAARKETENKDDKEGA